jgi:hypothetical protein
MSRVYRPMDSAWRWFMVDSLRWQQGELARAQLASTAGLENLPRVLKMMKAWRPSSPRSSVVVAVTEGSRGSDGGRPVMENHSGGPSLGVEQMGHIVLE